MRVLVVLFFCTLLSACEWGGKPIPSARESGELTVVTRNGPTTYFENAQGQYVGIEHDLVMLFAKDLGFKVNFVVTNQFHDVLPKVASRQAHFAAAGITITDDRKMRLLFSTAYQSVQQQVVYNIKQDKPNSFQDLLGKKLVVVAGTSYVNHLNQAKRKFPALTWIESKDQVTEDLLAQLAAGEIDYVVADSHIVKLSQNFHPELAVGFDIGRPEYLGWAFPKDGDAWLYKKSIQFFAKIQRDGTLKRLQDRYYGHIERLEQADVIQFLIKMNTVLPKYRDMYYEAQDITGIDWRLLAALGYQESKWDPLATSPTNVRGIMMLTEQTADEMGVTDRLDPRQSIIAGSKYLLNMNELMPARITEPDRTWLGLASYNVGYGHLEDARVLAQRKGLNPDVWPDLKKTLPLLANAAYHSTVKHGFARGGEPVIFTENIRTYYDILVKFEKPYRPLFSTLAKNNKPAKKKLKKTAASL
ncbi:MAG: membrane-bound lytic murein transglycosylase MltF [Burkholderiales bacterium]|nr:membrane-bound lytic murein transglycosylase MltF [Burkholderiales bacterium]